MSCAKFNAEKAVIDISSFSTGLYFIEIKIRITLYT